MKSLRYYTSWASIPHSYSQDPSASVYRAEIWVEDYDGEAEGVTAADNACTIEWQSIDKLTPVQPSRAQLTLASETDRQFYELYTTKQGHARLDIYRDGQLYWSGTLDTESYEEDYSMAAGYDVTLTFSDFACLDRLKWDGKRMVDISDVITDCIDATGIAYDSITLMSTTHDDNGPIDFDLLRVLGSNFYDDGDPRTLREVLDAVLQPFALTMVQKAGRICIYDYEALLADAPTVPIEWDGTDQRIGADKTYNNVRVTFSPYPDSTIADGHIEHGDALPDDGTQSYSVKTGNHFDEAADGFTIHVGSQADVPVSGGAKVYRIDSDYSGSDEAGIAWAVKTIDGTMLGNATFPRAYNPNTRQTTSSAIYTLDGGFISRGQYQFGNDQAIRIKLDALVDTRYNPFEQASIDNEQGDFDRLQNWCNFGYIPVRLLLKSSSGAVLYHYENRMCLTYETMSVYGRWVAGEGAWGDMWLMYYDVSDRKSKSGFGGWKANRQSIGYYRDELPSRLTKMGEGELVSLPPVSGYLELQIGSGLYQVDYGRTEKDIYSILRWLLYRDPTIEVVRANGTELSLDDIEDSAWIDPDAKEELSIDTIVGTADEQMPHAKGLIFRYDNSVATDFSRAGVSDRLERLLIGTAFSQHYGRKVVLTGTARLIPSVAVLTDDATDGKFVVLGETQDLRAETSQIKAAEIVNDNYEGIEYGNV